MTRDELKIKILAAYSDEEWEMLRRDEFPVPGSAFNRKTLLRLMEAIPNPDANLPVMLSCVSLSFIFSEPIISYSSNIQLHIAL